MSVVYRFIRFVVFKFRYLILKKNNNNFNVGNGFKSGTGCTVSRKNKIFIGKNFFMGNYCHLSSNLNIGDDVMFASFVSCVGGDHKIDNIKSTINKSGRDLFKTIEIKNNVWIGHGAIIMHGVTIKEAPFKELAYYPRFSRTWY
jgi:acetyltransferase-like isoleucine patch superfamily enzyme